MLLVLARLGWSPALTRDGVARTDILATWPASGHMIEVQVKTASYVRNPRVVMGNNAQQLARSDHSGSCSWRSASVRRTHHAATSSTRDRVAAAVWIAHQNWLTDPSVPPGQRNAHIDQARTRLNFSRGTATAGTCCTSPLTARRAAPTRLPRLRVDRVSDCHPGIRGKSTCPSGESNSGDERLTPRAPSRTGSSVS